MRKRNISKAVAAAGLAAATLVSGLSFGSAAIAAPENSPRATSTDAGEWSAPFKIVFKSGSSWRPLTDNRNYSWIGSEKSFGSSAEADRAAIAAYEYNPSTKQIRKFVGGFAGTCFETSTYDMASLASCSGSVSQKWDFVQTPHGMALKNHNGKFAAFFADGSYGNPMVVNGLESSAMVIAIGGYDSGELSSVKVDSEDRASKSAVLSGRGTVGATIDVNGQTTTVGADGSWKFTVTGLKLQTQELIVKQLVDGAEKDRKTVTADLSVAATTANVELKDDVTKKAVVSGTATPGANILAHDANGKQIGGGYVGTSGDYSFEIDAPNKGGEANVSVVQQFGNEQVNPVSKNVAYGAAPTIDTPADGADHDGGTVRLEGTGEPNANVIVRADGQPSPIGIGKVSSSGSFDITTTVPLDNAEHSLEVIQTGKGNNLTTSTPVTLNPGAGDKLPNPTDLRVVFDQNVFRKATVTGHVEPNARVDIHDGKTLVGSGSALSNGSFSVLIDPQSAGKHTLTVTQTLDGNSSEADVDADYGQAFSVNTPAATKDSTQVQLTGTAPAGAQVSFRDDTGTTRNATADGNGTWSATGNFRPDTTKVNLAAHSKGALVQRADTPITVKVTTRPITVTSPTQADADADRIKDGDVTFTGTATPFSTVQFATWPGAEGRLLFTTYADANGNWTATGWLGKSYYKLVGTQYPIGDSSNQYSMFAFSTVGFTQTVVTTPPADGVVRPNTKIRVSGTATPGSTVKITNGTTEIATATTQGDGTWTTWPTFADKTTYNLVAEQTSLSNKTSNTPIPQFTTETFHNLDQMNYDLQGTAATFTMRAQPGATVEIYTGPKDQPWARMIASGKADEFGKVTLAGYLTPNNPYQLKVYQSSTTGNQTTDWNFTTPSN